LAAFEVITEGLREYHARLLLSLIATDSEQAHAQVGLFGPNLPRHALSVESARTKLRGIVGGSDIGPNSVQMRIERKIAKLPLDRKCPFSAGSASAELRGRVMAIEFRLVRSTQDHRRTLILNPDRSGATTRCDIHD
jgi:hypothetical protein